MRCKMQSTNLNNENWLADIRHLCKVVVRSVSETSSKNRVTLFEVVVRLTRLNSTVRLLSEYTAYMDRQEMI